jgi:SAM-dependent methyltransferase
MGTGRIQGELWGARARDWAEANEPAWTPAFEAVLENAAVGPGLRYLDIGCGAGGALAIADGRGASVAGLDASVNLVTLARTRLPDATIAVGDMEALPFADGAFDVVTGINAFQFAGDVAAALREACRVCRLGGVVSMVVWGPRQHCDLLSKILPGVFALLPPPPPDAPAPTPFGEPGVVEDLLRRAGLTRMETHDIVSDLVFPSRETALTAILSASARVIRHAGEETVADVVKGRLATLAPAGKPLRLANRLVQVIGVRA